MTTTRVHGLRTRADGFFIVARTALQLPGEPTMKSAKRIRRNRRRMNLENLEIRRLLTTPGFNLELVSTPDPSNYPDVLGNNSSTRPSIR